MRLDKQLEARRKRALIKEGVTARATERRRRTSEGRNARTDLLKLTGKTGVLGAVDLSSGQSAAAITIVARARRLVDSGAATNNVEAFNQIKKTKEGARLFRIIEGDNPQTKTNKTPSGIPFKVK